MKILKGAWRPFAKSIETLLNIVRSNVFESRIFIVSSNTIIYISIGKRRGQTIFPSPSEIIKVITYIRAGIRKGRSRSSTASKFENNILKLSFFVLYVREKCFSVHTRRRSERTRAFFDSKGFSRNLTHHLYYNQLYSI